MGRSTGRDFVAFWALVCCPTPLRFFRVDKMMTTGGTVALGVSGVDVDVRFSHDSDEGEVLDDG